MPDKKVLVDGNYLKMNCVTTIRVIHHIIENIAAGLFLLVERRYKFKLPSLERFD
jgi:hypothetical protein